MNIRTACYANDLLPIGHGVYGKSPKPVYFSAWDTSFYMTFYERQVILMVKELDKIMFAQLRMLAHINKEIKHGEPELVAKNVEVMINLYSILRCLHQDPLKSDEQL